MWLLERKKRESEDSIRKGESDCGNGKREGK